MERIQTMIEQIADWIWGFPMIFLLLAGGIYFTIQLGFLPIRRIRYIYRETLGSLFRRKKETATEGTLTPFQAFTSALASTAGATNIVGVPIAIAFGGPGALFWMWIVAIIGMSLIYAEQVLGLRYREKNDNGEYVGGPYYYMKKGLNWRWISKWYAAGLMLEIIPSCMVQAHSVSTTAKYSFHFSPIWIGIGLVILTALVVFGGVKRIGKVNEKLLPILVVLYVLFTLIVIFSHSNQILPTFRSILLNAFTPAASIGSFAGANIIMTMRWGLARGLYTSKTGIGTSSIASATATVEYPSQQAFWGIIAVFLDTLVICTLTGLTVLTTNVWYQMKATESPSMVIEAFRNTLGALPSKLIITIMIAFFVLATLGVIIYYGEKQAETLAGQKTALFFRFVYLGSIFLGALGSLTFTWKLLDLLLAAIVVPNVIAILRLAKEVKQQTSMYLEAQKNK